LFEETLSSNPENRELNADGYAIRSPVANTLAAACAAGGLMPGGGHSAGFCDVIEVQAIEVQAKLNQQAFIASRQPLACDVLIRNPDARSLGLDSVQGNCPNRVPHDITRGICARPFQRGESFSRHIAGNVQEQGIAAQRSGG